MVQSFTFKNMKEGGMNNWAMLAINPPQWDHPRCQGSEKNVNTFREKKPGDISQRMWVPGLIWNESCHWKSEKSGERMALQGRKSDLREHEIRTQHLVGNDAVCGGQMKKRGSKPDFKTQFFCVQFGNVLFPYMCVCVLSHIQLFATPWL